MTETKPKVTDANKKFKNEDLPHKIYRKVWHRVFVLTFMMHVTQQDNPFENNIKVGCAVMQKIWDKVFSEMPHKIVHSSPVYQLVSVDFQFICL